MTKTQIFIDLSEYGQDVLFPRSLAKQILLRCECFKEVTLDFEGIDLISPSFADEIFRVYHHSHPEVEFFPINTNDRVSSMIRRAVKAKSRKDGIMEKHEDKRADAEDAINALKRAADMARQQENLSLDRPDLVKAKELLEQEFRVTEEMLKRRATV